MACKMYSVICSPPVAIKGTKLYKVEMYGCSTVVDSSIKEGQLGLLCLPDCIISEATLDELGIKLPYISGGRVKPLKLVKGSVYSDSLFIPVSQQQLDNLTTEALKSSLLATKVSKQPTEVEEGVIWTTYKPVETAPRRQDGKYSKSSKVVRAFPTFPTHINTAQYKFNIDRINQLLKEGWGLEVSRKYHGTSGRTGYSIQPYKLKWWQVILDKIGFKQEREKLQYAYGSRRVVLGQRTKNSSYPKDNFRSRASLLIESYCDMKEGDVVYYELVGYTDTGKFIQPPMGGKPYTYGVKEGETGIIIYRWTSGGKDLSYVEIYKRLVGCEKFNITIPKMYPVCSLKHIEDVYNSLEYKNITESSDCIEEGIVIHLLKDGKSEYYKWKTPSFYLAESTAYENSPAEDEDSLN